MQDIRRETGQSDGRPTGTEPPFESVKPRTTLAQGIVIGGASLLAGVGTFVDSVRNCIEAVEQREAVLKALEDEHPARTPEELAALRTARFASSAGIDDKGIVSDFRKRLGAAKDDIAKQAEGEIAEADRRAPVPFEYAAPLSGLGAGLGAGIVAMLTMAGLHAVMRRRGSYKFRNTEVTLSVDSEFELGLKSITFNSDASRVVLDFDPQTPMIRSKRLEIHDYFKTSLGHTRSKRTGEYALRLKDTDNNLPGRREDMHKVFSKLAEMDIITSEQNTALCALADDMIDRAMRTKKGAPTLADSFGR